MSIRVLIIEDSPTVRAHIREALESDGDIEIIGEAGDGQQGVELCASLKPDVVTLDMVLPVVNGQEATEYIMAHCPTPILIVSSSTNRGELFHTYEALAAGALDVMEKPRDDEDLDAWSARLASTIRLIAAIKVITHPRPRRMKGTTPPSALLQPPDAIEPGRQGNRFRIIAIGASTGGPAAILRVLQQFPPAFPIPIVIVLHLGDPFGSGFADWFDKQVRLPVRFATEGRVIESGVWLAPPNRHMLTRNGRLVLSDAPERHSCRPSVDVLFESVASAYGEHALGCVLTGMGRDGAAGLLAMRKAGALTIAQDEATSVIYGMPREAVLLDAADRVLPLDAIGPALLSFARQTIPVETR